MENKTIGQNIARLRKENNMSQSDLAKILNVSNKTISKWECGNGIPDVLSLKNIANTFNISIDDLVSSSTSINKENKNDNTQDLANNRQQNSSKSISKKSITIIGVSLSLVAVLIIALLCYFFVPRKPKIENSNKYFNIIL